MNQVYLFPLNDSMLFKRASLPFHIYEERYKKMIKDSLDNHTPITVVTKESNDHYSGKVCVSGTPIVLKKYDDDRMDVVLTGIEKIKLTEFVDEDPYKIYESIPIDEIRVVSEDKRFDLHMIKRRFQSWVKGNVMVKIAPDHLRVMLSDTEMLLSYASIFLISDTDVKKHILEAESFDNKIDLIIQGLVPDKINLGSILGDL